MLMDEVKLAKRIEDVVEMRTILHPRDSGACGMPNAVMQRQRRLSQPVSACGSKSIIRHQDLAVAASFGDVQLAMKGKA